MQVSSGRDDHDVNWTTLAEKAGPPFRSLSAGAPVNAALIPGLKPLAFRCCLSGIYSWRLEILPPILHWPCWQRGRNSSSGWHKAQRAGRDEPPRSAPWRVRFEICSAGWQPRIQ